MRRIAFQTLGCRLNQYETDSIATQFVQAGYRIVPFEERADAYVINTCTVTNKADRKSRNLINRALRISGMLGKGAQPADVETPDGEASDGDRSIVVVTGCYAESHAQQLHAEGLAYVVGNSRKNAIFQIVDAHFRGEILTPTQGVGDRFDFNPAAPVFHTRSMVKIQDGCDNFCSFCIIPYVRGRAASRPADSVLADVHANLALGYREIVLTGVNISRYRDAGDGSGTPVGFSALLERILAIPQDFRLRISSLEPESLDDRFFRLLEHPRMCPHLHLCLQSGSERILLAMRRQYTVRDYVGIVARIRERIPDFNVTTDIIVGFPGENDAEFSQTCRVVHDLEFGHIHVFPFSKRTGTRAERMPDQVADAVKRERGRVIRALSDKYKITRQRAMIGTRQRMLVETIERDAAGNLVGQGYGAALHANSLSTSHD